MSIGYFVSYVTMLYPPLSPPIKGGDTKRETSYYFPLPLWERARERGIFRTMTKKQKHKSNAYL